MHSLTEGSCPFTERVHAWLAGLARLQWSLEQIQALGIAGPPHCVFPLLPLIYLLLLTLHGRGLYLRLLRGIYGGLQGAGGVFAKYGMHLTVQVAALYCWPLWPCGMLVAVLSLSWMLLLSLVGIVSWAVACIKGELLGVGNPATPSQGGQSGKGISQIQKVLEEGSDFWSL